MFLKQKNMDVDLGGFLSQNDTYDYDDDYVYTDVESEGGEAALIPVLYSVVLLVGLLGNVPLMALLAQKRLSWTLSDTFVLHLGAADLLLLVTLPLRVSQAAHHGGWFSGVALCKISGAVFNINFYVGILLLACIGVDRCLSIDNTTQLYSREKLAWAHLSCLLVWIFSLLLTIPDWIFLTAEKDAVQMKSFCVHSYPQSATDWRLLSHLPHLILGFLLPAATLIICCFRVLLRLQQSSKKLQKDGALRVFLPLVVVFFLCWIPYNITLIVDTSRGRSERPQEGSLKTALRVTSALACVHACLRPLLYLILCENFRKLALAALRCATVESKSSLWELGVGEGEEAPPDQSHELEALKQVTSAEEQVQSSQC